MNPGEQVHWHGLRKRLSKKLGNHGFWKLWLTVQRSNSEMRRFRGIGRGRRCFILGGGPSLKKADPAPLRNEVTFGVNGIFLIEDWLGFLPTYYVVEDNLVIEDRKAEIGAMRGPHKFYSRFYKDVIPESGTRTLINVVYDYSEYPEFPEFGRNAAKGIWCGGTVTYLCLQLAYYMGFEEAYMVGMDHNYRRPHDVKAVGSEWTSQSEDPNHFHPDYFGKGKRWHDPRVDRMEEAYKKGRRVFESEGRKVFNATVGGHLEVLPRVEYDSLFS